MFHEPMWSHIKEILQKENAKCIIIEDGKPSFVVLPFEEYLMMKESRKASVDAVAEKIDRELSPKIPEASLRIPEVSIETVLSRQPESPNNKIRIEDLPF